MRALRTITLTSCIVALSACATTTNRNTDEAFETYARAVDSQDVEQMLSMYSEDATWTVNGQVVAEGRDKVKDSFEYSTQLGSTTTISDFEVEGDTVKVHMVESSDFYELFGLDCMDQYFVFEFEDGEISAVRTALDPEDLQVLGRNMPAFFTWLGQNHTGVYRQLFDAEGQLVRSGELGAELHRLAREWRAETQG